MNRRTFIAGSAATASIIPFWQKLALADSPTLRAAAAAKGIVYGSNFRDLALVKGDSGLEALTEKQCALVESGRLFQWANTRPSPTSFNFSRTDQWMAWAQSHRFLVSECHLLWHNSTGKWLKHYINPQNARDLLTHHISTLAGRYAGKMYSWVVVNEAILLKDGRSDGLRNTLWLQNAGPDYIDLAFKTAAAADPHAILIYNDFGVEHDNPASIEKRKVLLSMLDGMLKRRIPIHALGIQGHVDAEGPRGFSAPGLTRFVNDVTSLGLKIFITELDVGDAKLPGDEGTRDSVASKVYEGFLDAVLQNPKVTTVITWSLADKYNWRNDWDPHGVSKERSDGLPSRGLPFGSNLESTPIADAMIRAFKAAPSRAH